jgi:transcriptional regulator with XRE-family HTH domain
MSFQSLREKKRLSQEHVAESSGLSLRTIQRLEAGHRVSYASIRALAACFEVDADQLERELYALDKSSEDFVEIPRWVRLLSDDRWFAHSRLSRRDARVIEGFLVGLAVILFAVSFLARSAAVSKVLCAGAAFELVCAYLVTVSIRIIDKYNLWHGGRNSGGTPQQFHRTWRSRSAEYALMFGVGIAATAAIIWLAL